MAATDLDDWAKTEAAPSATEISKVRQLIHRLEHDLDGLTEEEHQKIRDACAVLRKSRQVVHLGLPTIPRPRRISGRSAGPDDHPTPLGEARTRATALRHQRVLAALDQWPAAAKKSPCPP